MTKTPHWAKVVGFYALAEWVAFLAMLPGVIYRGWLHAHHVRLPFYATAEMAYVQIAALLLTVIYGAAVLRGIYRRRHR